MMVMTTSASIETVTTALVASSSPLWRWRTNCGTSVAVSTPPSRSSYTMFGVSFAYE